MYIVTIKIKPDPNHNPHNKKTGVCPTSFICTDSTGAHHSFLVHSEKELEKCKERYHITRIEEVEDPNIPK